MILRIDDYKIFKELHTINLSSTPNQIFEFEFDNKAFEITIRYFNDVVSTIDCVIDGVVEFEHAPITYAYQNLLYLTRKYPDIVLYFAFNQSLRNNFKLWNSDIVSLCVGKVDLDKVKDYDEENEELFAKLTPFYPVLFGKAEAKT
ncbi:hypothetical protein [Helicobacter ganmani]|uniref:hypothetical protein n=1 Tax=Helicobacter ganmani TaxID=60246 RepID=UPI003A84ED8E